MCPKARQRLQQFNDRHNLAQVYLFAERVMAEVERIDRPKRADALRVQTAIAIEILLHCALRIGNLAGLRIGHELDLDDGATCPIRIAIPGRQVKNGEPLDHEVPPEAARLGRRYVRRYRPLLVANPGSALFPNRSGGTKRADDFSRQIKATLWRECGVVVHSHLFRHLGATQHLRRNPGAYETVSRVLGHRSRDTTYRYYTSEETRSAVARFDQEVLGLQEGLRDNPGGKRRRG